MYILKIKIQYANSDALWYALNAIGGNFENQILNMPVDSPKPFRVILDGGVNGYQIVVKKKKTRNPESRGENYEMPEM